jgi:hypothetical protein
VSIATYGYAGSGGGVAALDAFVDTAKALFVMGEDVNVTIGFKLNADCSGATVKADLFLTNGTPISEFISVVDDFSMGVWKYFSATLTDLPLGNYYITTSIVAVDAGLDEMDTAKARFIIAAPQLMFELDTTTDRELYEEGDVATVRENYKVNIAQTYWVESFLRQRGTTSNIKIITKGYKHLVSGDNVFTFPVVLSLSPAEYYIFSGVKLVEVDPYYLVSSGRCQFDIQPVKDITAGVDGLITGIDPTPPEI